MKITKSELRSLIKEELLKEAVDKRIVDIVKTCLDEMSADDLLIAMIRAMSEDDAIGALRFVMKKNNIKYNGSFE